jgi:hypothetical protein
MEFTTIVLHFLNSNVFSDLSEVIPFISAPLMPVECFQPTRQIFALLKYTYFVPSYFVTAGMTNMATESKITKCPPATPLSIKPIE